MTHHYYYFPNVYDQRGLMNEEGRWGTFYSLKFCQNENKKLSQKWSSGTIHDDLPSPPSPPADDLTTTTSERLEVTTWT